MSILVVAEHDNKNLKGATLNTLNAATQIGDEIHLLVAGHEANNVVEESQSLNGVTKIISVDNELYKNSDMTQSPIDVPNKLKPIPRSHEVNHLTTE